MQTKNGEKQSWIGWSFQANTPIALCQIESAKVDGTTSCSLINSLFTNNFINFQEIACLRDTQSTVQMLLNQENIASALECIHTAQEVLGSELRGANCFRHLGHQLEEMTRIIGKMLLEEFEGVVQREFAWPFEEMDDSINSGKEQQREEVIYGEEILEIKIAKKDKL